MNCIYQDLKNKIYYLKRFKLELNNKENYFLPDKKNVRLESFFINNESIKLTFKDSKTGKKRDDIILLPNEFISVKGIQALGKQMSNKPIKDFSLIENKILSQDNKEDIISSNANSKINNNNESSNNKQITMNFD